MLGLTLLLAGIFGLTTPWHESLPLQNARHERTWTATCMPSTPPLIEPETVIHMHVTAAREGREPRVVTRLYSGWVLFGERQFVRGYCLLLPDPVVPMLNTLGAQERLQFLNDMGRVGDALLKVAGAARINYAIFGNQEPALHAHVVPRYTDE